MEDSLQIEHKSPKKQIINVHINMCVYKYYIYILYINGHSYPRLSFAKLSHDPYGFAMLRLLGAAPAAPSNSFLFSRMRPGHAPCGERPVGLPLGSTGSKPSDAWMHHGCIMIEGSLEAKLFSDNMERWKWHSQEETRTWRK